MRLLIEGYKYDGSAAKQALKGLDYFQNISGQVSINYVGYLYNPHINDCVFILPKVLISNNIDANTGKKTETVFGHDPHSLINFKDVGFLKDDQRDFIYEFAVWIYRTIFVYNQHNPKNEIVLHRRNTEISANHRHMANTFLEVIMALVDFNRKNNDFFMTILKNIHSGYNKINWTRTISKSNAILAHNSTIYLNPINKRRQINFDEELLVIYFSILDYVNKRYGFPVDIKLGFDLIQGEKFQRYLNGYGLARLKQIKYKYFSDKALHLWELCFAFFGHSENVSVATELNEYLIASNFNNVFESIIDELIGDPDNELPKYLKNQKDGKRIDHLYSDEPLTVFGEADTRSIFYIGDSKYYQLNNAIPEESVYKQYTYARNLIQWNLDIFQGSIKDEGNWKSKIRELRDLRDNTTEGYGIVPNFFISATMAKDQSYDDTIFETEKSIKTYMQSQFENRLFDRDTLIISHYDVNFLYIVSLYSRDNESEKSEWKHKVRTLFRNQIRKMLEKRFDFYAMQPKNLIDADKYIKENFQNVLGKVSRPYSNDRILSLALDNYDDVNVYPEEERRMEGKSRNLQLINELEQYFTVMPIKLEENPESKLPPMPKETISDFLRKEPVLVTFLKNKETWKIIRKHKFVYAPMGMGKGSLHLGSGYEHTKYVLLHGQGERHLFKTAGYGPRIATAEELKGYGLNPERSGIYMVFDLKSIEDISVPGFNLAEAKVGGRADTTARFTLFEDLIGKYE